jgi:hypothetical protein
MELQELFDMSVGGVIKQGKPAFDKNLRRCMYRMYVGNETLKCAAGQVLPDENYDKFMENTTVANVTYFIKNFSVQALELLQKLQRAHDKIFDDATVDKHDFDGVVQFVVGGHVPIPGNQEWLDFFRKETQGIADTYGLQYKF